MIRRVTITTMLFTLSVLLPPAWYIRTQGMRFFDREFALWKAQIEGIESNDSGQVAETLILGDSTAMADFLPDTFPMPTRSLGLGGAGPIEIHFLLKKYLERNHAPKRVIITLAPYHLEDIEVFWERTVKFGLLMSLSEELETLKLAGKLDSPIGFDGSLFRSGFPGVQFVEIVLMHLGFLPHYQVNLLAGKIWARASQNEEVYRKIAEDKGHFDFQSDKPSLQFTFETERRYFRLNPLLKYFLVRILDRLASENSVVTWVVPPAPKSSVDRLFETYTQGYRQSISSLLDRYPNVHSDLAFRHFPDSSFTTLGHLAREEARQHGSWFASHYFGVKPAATSEARL